MRLSLIRTGAARALRLCGSRAGTTLLFGLVAGWYVVAWFHQLTAVLGLSLTTVTAVALAAGLGIELAWRRPRPLPPTAEAPVGAFALLCIVPAAWTVGFAWLMQAAGGAIGRFSIEELAAPGPRLLLSLGVAVVALGVPVYALTRIPLHLVRLWQSPAGEAGRGIEARSASEGTVGGSSLALQASIGTTCALFLSGVAVGILADVLLLAPLVGVQWPAFAALLGSACLFVPAWRHAAAGRVCATHPQSEERGVFHTPYGLCATHPHSEGLGVFHTPYDRKSGRRRDFFAANADALWSASVVICLGGLTALAMRMTHQLMPATGFLIWTEWAVLILAVAMGMLWSERRLHFASDDGEARLSSLRWGACLLAAGWCAALPILFSWHVGGLLLVNSYVAPVWLQLSLRCLVVLTMLGPLGFAWGMLAATARDRRGFVKTSAPATPAANFPQFSLLSFVAGLLAVWWLILPRWPIENVLPAVAAVLAAAACVRWLAAREIPRGRTARAATAALLCLAALSPFVRQRYNPARAARLLFSTQVFLAKRAGMEARLLPHIDEGRLVTRREGEHGTYTLWKLRSIQLHLREGGLPKAIVSNNTRVCPQFSADVMQAALPLVLHQQPRRVLLLGLQGGVTLDTCFHFPLQELTCAESDPALIRLVSDVLLASEKRDLFQDPRVRMLPLDPALAVAAAEGGYDVMISCPDQSALAQSAPYFTLEFYRRAARRLAADGIFCQRFQYVDFGPDPLRMAAATMQGAFRTVTAVETASGELALLGTNSPQGLIREGLVSRLEALHVRNVLGQAGWDWPVPLNLSAYDTKTLSEFAAENRTGRNTAANGRFAFGLPLEVMRWGAKWEEIRDVLAARTGSLLKWSSEEEARDALLRLEEITGQRTLIIRYPDQKWAYRKTLRERMSTRSRQVIRQVKGGEPERRLHPDDQRRKDYLAALGDAVKQPHVDNIRRVAGFAQPYDPLVSFFLHDETARLYARTRHPDPAAELEHRLHLVYFTDPRDRSVRNIVAALNLLVEHPQAAPDAIQRRDHFDALLQMLKSRWHGRGASTPVSRNVALNDVAESVSAIMAAFGEMERIYAENGLDRDEWEARRRVLEQALLRPLRTYRTQLLAQRPTPKMPPERE